MVWTAIAYNDGKRVKPVWDSKGFRFFNSTTSFSVPETDNPQLIWDMRGIIRNRPDPSLLPFSSDGDTYVDFGLIWGEDIIDLIMLDRGKVVLPLRNLQGFSELDIALNYAADITIAIDWSQSVQSSSNDFSIDIVDLLKQLHKRGQRNILIYSLLGEYPYIPAGMTTNLNIKLVFLSDYRPPPQWARGVLVFE